MATASLTLSSISVYPAEGVIYCNGHLAVDAAPDDYATGGLTVTSVIINGDLKTVKTKPYFLIGSSIGGYNFAYDYTNGKILVFDGASELAAAAIPAALSTNGIDFFAAFDPGRS